MRLAEYTVSIGIHLFGFRQHHNLICDFYVGRSPHTKPRKIKFKLWPPGLKSFFYYKGYFTTRRRERRENLARAKRETIAREIERGRERESAVSTKRGGNRKVFHYGRDVAAWLVYCHWGKQESERVPKRWLIAHLCAFLPYFVCCQFNWEQATHKGQLAPPTHTPLNMVSQSFFSFCCSYLRKYRAVFLVCHSWKS